MAVFAAAMVVAIVGGAASASVLAGTPAATAAPSAVAAATSTAAPALTVGPTTAASPSPTSERYVEATTSGVLIPASEEYLAYRHPIAVMIDDQIHARPQGGLSQADVVYQAPAEGGVPRYMAIFQTQDPPLIGPIRSARLYFVVWAEEWRAMYVHVGGATNAKNYIYQNTGKWVFNADEIHWGVASGYFDRVGWRESPHNVFTSGVRLQALCTRLSITVPMMQPFWVFTDPAPIAQRPYGGKIVVPYYANNVVYSYNHDTNTYFRSVTGETVQTDIGNNKPVNPTTVVVLYQPIGFMAYNPATSDARKGRLEIGYNGTGRAEVFENGQVIDATWSKKNDYSPTLLYYSSGPNKGRQVDFVRGQIFVQIVDTAMPVTWTVGSATPSGSASPGASASPAA